MTNTDPTKYIVINDKKLIYVNNPKVACSSIKRTFLDNPQKKIKIHRVKWYKYSLNSNEKKYFKFTFVRNPFKRLVSCYKEKFTNNSSERDYFLFDVYLFGFFKHPNNFEEFIKTIIQIPDFLAEKHFKSQYFNLLSQGEKIDYFGKLENISEDFKIIKKKFDLSELPHSNSTNKGNYMDYYTPELVELVYEKYKDSLNSFGYIKEYKKLKKYVNNKKY